MIVVNTVGANFLYNAVEMEILREALPTARKPYHPSRSERRQQHTSQRQVWPHTSGFLERLLARQESYVVPVRGVDVVVHPGVFPPTTDTHLIANYLHCSVNTRILDLGTGSGALAA